MKELKQIAKKIPLLIPLYRMLRNEFVSYQLKSKDTEQVFTDIYKHNAWGGKDSVSGPGSNFHQTRIISKELPALFRDYRISSILDMPCGDFHWMKNVDLTGMDYTGADIVNELIEKNSELYQRDDVRFQTLNLIRDELPKVDLVFCRDCLVHLSLEDILCALKNLCNSQSEYILTTTFTKRTENHDIATGQWRALNLELSPFMLPRPLKVINEGCTEGNGNYKDKSLGLWRIADVRKSLAKHSS